MLRRTRFNGASTFQSRKGVRRSCGRTDRVQASMGPRPFSRGRSPRHNLLVAFGLRRRFREVVSDEGSREASSTCPFCKHCSTNTLRMREVPGVCTPQDLSKHDSRKKTRYTITARRSGTFTRGSPQNSMQSSPRAPAGPRSITITRS